MQEKELGSLRNLDLWTHVNSTLVKCHTKVLPEDLEGRVSPDLEPGADVLAALGTVNLKIGTSIDVDKSFRETIYFLFRVNKCVFIKLYQALKFM